MKLPEVDVDLLPLKVVLFCLFGAHACLIPYMTIHMKDLGISVEETSYIYTFLPFTQIMGSPLAGAVADKLGQYKPVLIISLLLTSAFSTAIMFVPPAANTYEHVPHRYITCNSSELNLIIESCNQKCENNSNIKYDLFASSCDKRCFNSLHGSLNSSYETNMTSSISITNIHLDMPELKEDLCSYSISASKTPLLCYSEDMDDENCTINCDITLVSNTNETNYLSTNCFHTNTNKRLTTVWIYFGLRVMFQIFVAICISLTDATTLHMVESHGGQYGRQRFWAILATAIFSPVTGILVDLVSEEGHNDYSPAFYFFNGLTILTVFAVASLKMELALPEENMWKNAVKLFRLPVVIILFFIIFWLGTVWGFIESFLFWYLLDLNSPTYLLGLTLTIGSGIGLPFLHYSEWFVRHIGQVNLLIIALMFYFIRCFGYSFISNPWWCIPFEAMEAFTYHTMWVAAATYSAKLCPRSLLGTMQGFVSGIHYGVGRGSGSFIGGNIMSNYGGRIAFRAMGVISGGFCVIYALIHYGVVRKFNEKQEKMKKAIELELSIAEDIPPEEDPLSGEGEMPDELKRYLAQARKSIESRGPVL
ncbi:major facilitator superfamily domain-containing protein 6-like [Centruroides vittatus]|uniref:major facilitator superfamily domain-containing protein 6-like n=1 Tax=Centruroides vittatus TaxID=120091 RepID=UPI003510AF97